MLYTGNYLLPFEALSIPHTFPLSYNVDGVMRDPNVMMALMYLMELCGDENYNSCTLTFRLTVPLAWKRYYNRLLSLGRIVPGCDKRYQLLHCLCTRNVLCFSAKELSIPPKPLTARNYFPARSSSNYRNVTSFSSPKDELVNFVRGSFPITYDVKVYGKANETYFSASMLTPTGIQYGPYAATKLRAEQALAAEYVCQRKGGLEAVVTPLNYIARLLRHDMTVKTHTGEWSNIGVVIDYNQVQIQINMALAVSQSDDCFNVEKQYQFAFIYPDRTSYVNLSRRNAIKLICYVRCNAGQIGADFDQYLPNTSRKWLNSLSPNPLVGFTVSPTADGEVYAGQFWLRHSNRSCFAIVACKGKLDSVASYEMVSHVIYLQDVARFFYPDICHLHMFDKQCGLILRDSMVPLVTPSAVGHCLMSDKLKQEFVLRFQKVFRLGASLAKIRDFEVLVGSFFVAPHLDDVADAGAAMDRFLNVCIDVYRYVTPRMESRNDYTELVNLLVRLGISCQLRVDISIVELRGAVESQNAFDKAWVMFTLNTLAEYGCARITDTDITFSRFDDLRDIVSPWRLCVLTCGLDSRSSMLKICSPDQLEHFSSTGIPLNNLKEEPEWDVTERLQGFVHHQLREKLAFKCFVRIYSYQCVVYPGVDVQHMRDRVPPPEVIVFGPPIVVGLGDDEPVANADEEDIVSRHKKKAKKG